MSLKNEIFSDFLKDKKIQDTLDKKLLTQLEQFISKDELDNEEFLSIIRKGLSDDSKNK